MAKQWAVAPFQIGEKSPKSRTSEVTFNDAAVVGGIVTQRNGREVRF